MPDSLLSNILLKITSINCPTVLIIDYECMPIVFSGFMFEIVESTKLQLNTQLRTSNSQIFALALGFTLFCFNIKILG